MFRKTITLFSIFGFKVRIDVSWLVILALVIWSLGGGVFPRRFEGLSTQTHWIMAVVAAMGLFASIVVHELCHSLAARRFGLPMTGITLFIFGGAAEMSDEPPSPAAEFWMAIAGPASSVAVAGAFLGLSYAGPTLGWPTAAVGVLRWVGWINVILVVFNLIPGFPLDGGRVLRAAIWRIRGDLRSATHTASRVGSGFGAAVMGLGVLRLLFLDPIGGLWLVLIGLFIRWAARSGYRQVLIREMLRGETVERFMNTDPLTVDASLSVEQLVEDYIYEHHYKMYPVIEDGGLAGCVSTRDVKDVPREQWSQKTVGEIARGCSETNSLSANTDAMDAFQQMNRHGVSRMLVVDDGRLRGIVALKDLMKFLSRRLELEGDSDGQQFGRQISAATDQS